VAVLSTILATVGLVKHTAGAIVPNLTAYHLAFVVAAILALVGAAGALAIRDSDAAPSMRTPEEIAAEQPTAEVPQPDRSAQLA